MKTRDSQRRRMTSKDFLEAANLRFWRRGLAKLGGEALRSREIVDGARRHVAARGDRQAVAVLEEMLAYTDAAIAKLAEIQAMDGVPPRSVLEPRFGEVDRLLDTVLAIQRGYMHEQGIRRVGTSDTGGGIYMTAADARN